ncbi:MAG TPA: hypothetical protein VKY85_12310 [Candidatus Angelobacter sp.]|nr:hypothetical protein [Candidatus Angelobacter sp.]
MSEISSNESVTAKEIIKTMSTRAGWMIFDAIVLAIIAAVGLIFREWIAVHWKGTLLSASFVLATAVAMFSWAYNAADSIYKTKLQEAVKAEQAKLQDFRNDVYADVILGYLKKGGGHLYFSTKIVAQKLDLPVEHVLSAIQFLRSKKFVRVGSQGSEWEFLATDATLADPYFVRNPIFSQTQEARATTS